MSTSNKNTILNVSFPSDKLEALKFYMAEKELTVDGELQKYVDNIYQKYVPAPTRRYLDRNDNGDGVEESPNNTRKNTGRKRAGKTQKAEEEVASAPVDNETIEVSSEEIQGEDQGMIMTM